MARILGYILLVLTTYIAGTPARRSKEISSYDDDYYDSDTPTVVTCPGFPGYCSESYVGDTCSVVCSRGRNNVPECQEDGTWTDIPRCIEHEPGVEEQVPGVCPGIPGYCSLDWPGAVCEFQCPVGPDIRSSCTEDGTWEPYPTCQGDPRETQDGCNPCPGPDGGPRNRTLEAAGNNGGRGGNNIPRGGGKKQGGGNRGGAGPRQGGGQKGGAGQRVEGGNRNSGGQRRGQGGHGGLGGGRSKEQNQRKEGPRRNQIKDDSQSIDREAGQAPGQCPGDELQACINVCPGFSARVFGACVKGCAKRCPDKK